MTCDWCGSRQEVALEVVDGDELLLCDTCRRRLRRMEAGG